MVVKAVSFALIGVVNTLVDAGVFFLAYTMLRDSPAAAEVLAWPVVWCGCGTVAIATLIAANTCSWSIAASGSYVMNSFITFAAESGRRLRWKAYGAFIASGIVGLIANTATLVVVAHFAPVWFAKGCSILASFVVNFSLSHFVVFRPRGQAATGEGG